MAKSTINIKAPIESVFAYVSDLTRHGEWAGHNLAIEPEQPGRIGVGARFRSHGQQFGRAINDTLMVTAYEPNRLFAFESVGPSGTWQHTYEIHPVGEGTVLNRTMAPGRESFLVRLASPIVNLFLRNRNERDLVRSKELIEGQQLDAEGGRR